MGNANRIEVLAALGEGLAELRRSKSKALKNVRGAVEALEAEWGFTTAQAQEAVAANAATATATRAAEPAQEPGAGGES